MQKQQNTTYSDDIKGKNILCCPTFAELIFIRYFLIIDLGL